MVLVNCNGSSNTTRKMESLGYENELNEFDVKSNFLKISTLIIRELLCF